MTFSTYLTCGSRPRIWKFNYTPIRLTIILSVSVLLHCTGLSYIGSEVMLYILLDVALYTYWIQSIHVIVFSTKPTGYSLSQPFGQRHLNFKLTFGLNVKVLTLCTRISNIFLTHTNFFITVFKRIIVLWLYYWVSIKMSCY